MLKKLATLTIIMAVVLAVFLAYDFGLDEHITRSTLEKAHQIGEQRSLWAYNELVESGYFRMRYDVRSIGLVVLAFVFSNITTAIIIMHNKDVMLEEFRAVQSLMLRLRR